MGQSRAFRAAAAAVGAYLGIATPQTAEAKPSLFALTPENFAAKVRVRDDALETKASFDTYQGWRERPSDVFLRAFVDKRTGDVEYQLYASVTSKGNWQMYDRINFADATQTVHQGELIRVGSNVDCGPVRWGGQCQLTEDAIFVVPEAVLRELAGLYAPGRQIAWQFKLKGKYMGPIYH